MACVKLPQTLTVLLIVVVRILVHRVAPVVRAGAGALARAMGNLLAGERAGGRLAWGEERRGTQ